MFISTADKAEGNATIGDVKWVDARTRPRDEFCIPTCRWEKEKMDQFLALMVEQKACFNFKLHYECLNACIRI